MTHRSHISYQAIGAASLGDASTKAKTGGDRRYDGPPLHPIPETVLVPHDKGEWTDLTIAALDTLWISGYATASIGYYLGFTKNAIVGKSRRLGLPARPSPIRWRNPDAAPTPRARPLPRVAGPTLPPLQSIAAGATTEPVMAVPRAPDARVRATRAVRTPMPPVTVLTGWAGIRPEPVPIERVRTVTAAPKPYGRIVTCCWPFGDSRTREFHFCDVPSEPGRPYCEEHVRIAYVRIRDRREDQALALL
jgi:GcrA cell cycle regulator